MPEFILDTTRTVHDRSGTLLPHRDMTWGQLDSFTQGYIEALFFTETSGIPMSEWHSQESQERLHAGTADGNIPEDSGFSDLSPESLAKIIADCTRFQSVAESLLQQAYDRDGYDESAAGRDFWYTRNGHGVGFWDRPQLDADGLGDKLSGLCGWKSRGNSESFPEVNVEFGSADESSPTGYGFVYIS